MIMMVWSITARTRHPGMWSQVGLREQSLWTKQVEVKEFQLSYPNPQRWCCESATLNVAVIWKTEHGPQDWKRSVLIPLSREAVPKNAQTTEQLNTSHTLAKWCSKFSMTDFNNTWTLNSQMFKLLLQKVEEPEIKLPTSAGSSKKQESFRNASSSALSTMPKHLIVWITINCGKYWKVCEYRTTWPSSSQISNQDKKQQINGKQTGSK